MAHVLLEQFHTGDVNSAIKPILSHDPLKQTLLPVGGSSCVVCPVTSPSSASASNGQIQPHESPKTVQNVGESPVMWMGPAPPHVLTQQESLGSPVSQVTDEATASALMKRDLPQESVQIQICGSGERSPESEASEVDDASHNEGDTRDPFSDISWEGWGLIKTPDGNYFPETFNPSPFGFEDLTDRW